MTPRFIKQNRLLISSVAYWLLLAYILSALIFWFIELQSQNQRMAQFKYKVLSQQTAPSPAVRAAIDRETRRKTAQYIGEGSVFLLVLLIASALLYQSVLRQIRRQQQQQNLMMAVTHELKTPIAITKLNVETLLKHPLDAPKRQQLLEASLSEINRLHVLTNNILVSAQLDVGRYVHSHEDLDFSQQVSQILSEFQRRFPSLVWERDLQDGLHLKGDALMLQMLVNNLLENAAKYSPPGATIRVQLSGPEPHPRLEVIDQGPGVADREKKKIFQKFYRIGNEQTRSSQGTGLGLYLSRRIASDHQARISVRDRPGQGSIFTVQF